MLYPSLILTFLFSIYTTSVQAITFPKYEEVVKMLIYKTETCKVDFHSGTKLSLEKREDGYWVGTARWDFTDLHYEVNQLQIFWSAKEQKYNSVKFEIEGANNTDISNNNLITPFRRPEQDPYNLHPFFGYTGWYHDVIKRYKNIEKERPLEDFELYSLARAYSKYAQILLSNPGAIYYGIASDFLTEDKASTEKIELYISTQDKAIDYFHQIYLKNPDWNTVVGHIFTKYSNEVLTKYQHLAIFTKHKDALKVLKGKKLYTEQTLNFVENILKSCPKDAILWTSGDNTSYPMSYLQQTRNIRKDVVVTDADLLVLSSYIKYVTDKEIHLNPIVLDLDPAVYYKKNNSYVLISNGSANLTIEALKAALTDAAPSPKTFNTKNIHIPLDKKGELKLNLPQNYLLKNEWISLFIFANNQRPLCFTSEFKANNPAFTQNLNIRKYLYPVGSVYQLNSKTYTVASEEELEARYHLFTEELKWIPIEEVAQENLGLFRQYLWSVNVLASDLHNSGKGDQAVYILDDFRRTFPLDPTVVGFNNLFYFINLYFREDVPTKAEILIQKHFETLLLNEYLNSEAFSFVQRVDAILQEQKIDKFNKIIQELYLKSQ